MSGEMVFNAETERTRAVMNVSRPASDGLTQMQMVSDGTVMYMRSDLFGDLPDGREWMGLDVSLGEDLDLFDNGGDATGELELLEAATGEIEKLGKEMVRGVSTIRYRGTIGVSEQVEKLQEEGADELATFIEENGTPMHVEAWIDGKGLVRRMKFVKSQPREDGDGSVTTEMRLDYYDFDLVPDIDVPDSDEVFDATSLAQDEIARSNDE
jgi:hypothetical protein